MLYYQSPQVKEHLFDGQFGLEKEMLRVTRDGHIAQTPHGFDNPHIVRDFCENQTEINTTVHDSVQGALEELESLTEEIQKTIVQRQEVLWPFSNPPIIRNEEDIPMAYQEKQDANLEYRKYLSNRYGRYRMTFCGIHYNFSFGKELLEASFEQSGQKDFRHYADHVYLDLAAKASVYGWLITMLTAASPLTDGSFYEKSLARTTCFTGMGSLRNSEQGYWNFFTPVVDCSSIEAYVRSVNAYVESGFLKKPSELYYPIRLKPAGAYDIFKLIPQGISHIELRMLDLNPLEKSGLAQVDAQFIHLFLVYLACLPDLSFDPRIQMMTEQNFKNAAHYDLKTTKIVDFEDHSKTVYQAALEFLQQMETFYKEVASEYLPIIEAEMTKVTLPARYRYAWIIRKLFEEDFLGKGLQLADFWQQQYLKNTQTVSAVRDKEEKDQKEMLAIETLPKSLQPSWQPDISIEEPEEGKEAGRQEKSAFFARAFVDPDTPEDILNPLYTCWQKTAH